MSEPLGPKIQDAFSQTYPPGAPKVLQDSGNRKVWESGMVREPDDSKPLFTLIPTWYLRRLADHMTRGAKKYSRDNWRKANSAEEAQRMKDSAWRHFVAWSNGETDEDHLAAVAFNMWAHDETMEKVNGH